MMQPTGWLHPPLPLPLNLHLPLHLPLALALALAPPLRRENRGATSGYYPCTALAPRTRAATPCGPPLSRSPSASGGGPENRLAGPRRRYPAPTNLRLRQRGSIPPPHATPVSQAPCQQEQPSQVARWLHHIATWHVWIAPPTQPLQPPAVAGGRRVTPACYQEGCRAGSRAAPAPSPRTIPVSV